MCSKEDDWGFTHFISWKDLLDMENGFVKDDAITIEAHVVAEAPHGVSWDSKKHTGYVGMRIKYISSYTQKKLIFFNVL